MILRHKTIGLAVRERSVTAAQVVGGRGGGSLRLVGAAEFVFPEGVSWHTPAELGQVLSHFLREQGMSGAAVVGLPGRYLVTAAEELPPAVRETQIGMLRLRAERSFSMDADEMVCDCGGLPRSNEAGQGLIVCTTRELVESVKTTVRAAGLRLRAVTSSAGALAMSAGEAYDGYVALVAADGVDIVRATGGQVLAIQHVSLPQMASASDASAAAVRMGLATLLQRTGGGGRRLVLWDMVGQDLSACADACASMGVEAEDEPAVAVDGVAEAAAGHGIPLGRLAAAAAVAGARQRSDWLPIDFASPGLAAPRQHRLRRWAVWGVFLLAVLLVAAVAVAAHRHALKRDIALLKAKQAEIAPSVAAAQEVVDSVTEARGWYDRRPPFLDSLVALTSAFPERGSVWATSLAIRDGMQGVLSGKATDEGAVLGLLDRLQDSDMFGTVKLMYVQETRSAGGDRAFAIAFTQAGADTR